MKKRLKIAGLFIALIGIFVLGEWLLYGGEDGGAILEPEAAEEQVLQEEPPVSYKQLVSPRPVLYRISSDDLIGLDQDVQLHDYPELDAVDVFTNFVGFLLAKEYGLAARLFSVDSYVSYFYEDFQELDDYVSRVSFFGEQFTLGGKLVYADVLAQSVLDSQTVLDVQFYYVGGFSKRLTLAFSLVSDGHGSHEDYYIVSLVDDLLEQLSIS